MMRPWLLAIVVAMRCSAPASANEAFVNGDALFKICDAQQKLLAAPTHELVDPESAYEAYECRYYVAGVANAMSALDQYRDCIPKTAKSDDLTRIVHAFLSQNHQWWKVSGFTAAASAIITAYHCK